MRTARLVEVGGGWGGWGRLLLAASTACIAITSTTCTTSTNLDQPVFYDPAHDLGPLFQAVQLSGIFEDSKTFADARPRFAPQDITARYVSAQRSPQFNLREFVAQQFELPRPVGEGFRSDRSQTMEQHIRALWPVLTRPPDTADEPVRRPGRPLSGGLLLGLILHDARAHRERPHRSREEHARQLCVPDQNGGAYPERQPDVLFESQPAAILRRHGRAVRAGDGYHPCPAIPRRLGGGTRVLDERGGASRTRGRPGVPPRRAAP